MENGAENTQKKSGQQNIETEGSLLSLKLPDLIEELKKEDNWKKTGRGARTIYKTGTLRIVLNVMQAGSEIKPHHANGPISVQVIEGCLLFNTEMKSVELRKGGLLMLQEYVQHDVYAQEETAFLLTVAPIPN